VHCHVGVLAGKQVLVVDDNSTNRHILQEQLLQWKFSPIMASSGQQALELFAQYPRLDLVVTDMHMPEMNGIQLAQALRKRRCQSPIVLLSSVGEDYHKHQADLFHAVLSKPIRPQQLCKVIVNALKDRTSPVMAEAEIPQKLSTDFAKRYPLEILIAEDNEINQLLTVLVIKKLGYEPAVALNGVEVLEAVSRKAFDVILMDIQMPEMDGLEATRLIRKQLKTQPVILAITANSFKEDREACLEAGMDGYLSKPIVLTNLVDAIEKWALKQTDQPNYSPKEF
jgi:CheY-like chemotaxis protein